MSWFVLVVRWYILTWLPYIIVASNITNDYQQLSLSYTSLSSEMVITWASFATNYSVGYCQYGLSPFRLSSIAIATSTTYELNGYQSPKLFKATMKDLMSGNKIYYYRVGHPNEGYSSIYSFKSHPGVHVKNVTFHFIGDPGQTVNTINTFQQIVENENSLQTLSGGIICVGDLSYANGDQPLWDSFGNMKQFTTAKIPMLTTVGNHEWFDDKHNLFIAYKNRFDNPIVNGQKELYYSFNVGLVHFIMVAGYCSRMKSVLTQPCLQNGTKELEWLQQDLKNVDTTVTPWTFVIFHQPYVNSNYKHNIKTEGIPMEDAIEDTLYESGIVDAVFSGHVHAYERSCRFYQFDCVDNAPYYITIGDGGNAEGLSTHWIEPQPDWSIYRMASYGHGELNVMNETHVLWQWHQNEDLSPVVADEFWIVKKSAARPIGRSVTMTPHFVDNDRGKQAELFDTQIRKTLNDKGEQRRSRNRHLRGASLRMS